MLANLFQCISSKALIAGYISSRGIQITSFGIGMVLTWNDKKVILNLHELMFEKILYQYESRN